jgi:hypothetical protein
VHPCPILAQPMGSLTEQTFRSMQRAEPQLLRFVERCPVNCWMNCTVHPAMRRRPWVPAWWVLRARLFGVSTEPRQAHGSDPAPDGSARMPVATSAARSARRAAVRRNASPSP